MTERQVRRALGREGLTLHKDRARTYSLNHKGGYMVVKTATLS
jgi:hypothetical protein